jgi:hypothetical protein
MQSVARHRWRTDQLSVGTFSALSMTNTSSIALLATSLKPSCCSTAAARSCSGSLAFSPGGAAVPAPDSPGRRNRKLESVQIEPELDFEIVFPGQPGLIQHGKVQRVAQHLRQFRQRLRLGKRVGMPVY